MAIAHFLLLAAVSAAALAKPGHRLTLGPVSGPRHGNVAPSKQVHLQYGSGAAGVNVSLAMQKATVLLESIASVASVECADASVSVSFNDSAAFASANAQWTAEAADGLVLITNHLGECDAELERGFFVAGSITAENSSLTLVARTSKTSVNETAGTAEITFSSIPATQEADANARRDITLDPSLNISTSVALPASTTLFADAPYVTITADKASLSASASVSGYLKYNVLAFSLEELYVDVDAAFDAELGLAVDVAAPYSTTATYTAPALSYALVDIPGILELGPALGFDIGVDLAADAAVSVSVAAGVAVLGGNAHVDFKDSAASTSSGWTPTYYANATISEAADVQVDPFVDVSVELACTILGGLLDLSIGLDARPRFNNNFTLSATQELSASGTTAAIAQPTSSAGACSQGVGIVSDFTFALIATVTEFWSDTLYNVTVPIADECYNF